MKRLPGDIREVVEQGKFTLEDGGKTLKVIFDISTRFNKVSD